MPSIKELQDQNKLLKEQAELKRSAFEQDKRRTKSLEESNNLVKQILDNEKKIVNLKAADLSKKEAGLEKQLLKSLKDSNVQAAKRFGVFKDQTRQLLVTTRLELKNKEQTEDIIGVRQTLNALAEKEQQVRDGIADGTSEKISKEEILSNISQDQIDLAKQQGINVGDIAGQIANASNTSVKFSKGISIAGKGISSIKGFLPGIAGVFALIVANVIEFGQNIQANRRELGLSVVEATKLSAQSQILGIRAKEFGLGTDAVRTIQADILSNLGGQAKLTTELVNDFLVLQGTLGVTSDTASKLVPILDSVGAAGERGAVAQIESLGALIRLEGLSPGQILGDVASNTEFFAKFAKDGGTNLIRAAVQARKLGLELSAVAGITESLLDFETSIEKQLEASLLLGRQINLDRARQLALTGDQEGLLEEVRRQIGDEAEFNRLNVIQRKALADAFGLQVEQVARAVRGNTAAVTGAAASGGDTGAQQVSLLENIDRGIGKVVGNTAE